MKNNSLLMQEALKSIVDAWEKLEGNKRYSPKEIERWLINDMKPAIDNARVLLTSH